MKLDLKWVFKKPIDMEHKGYILLDYISKVDKELDEFRIYPTFQELSIHLRMSVLTNWQLNTVNT